MDFIGKLKNKITMPGIYIHVVGEANWDKFWNPQIQVVTIDFLFLIF